MQIETRDKGLCELILIPAETDLRLVVLFGKKKKKKSNNALYVISIFKWTAMIVLKNICKINILRNFQF